MTETLTEGGIAALGDHGPVGWRVDAVAGRRALREVLEVRTRRRPFSLRVAGEEVAEVALDDTRISLGDGERPAELRRVEVEVVPAWTDALEPLVGELRSSCGLQPASLSKFEAGLLALGLHVPTVPDLGPTEVTPSSSLGDLAYAVLRRHLGALLSHEAGTRLGEDPEELHDMRVATRRLRAAIDLFKEVLPVRTRTLRDELSWLAALLGDVRDLDVQIGGMDGTGWEGSGDAGSRRRALDEVRALLEAERATARRHLLAGLDSSRWEKLSAGLCSLVQQGPSRRSLASRRPATLSVPVLIETRHAAVVKAARRARRSGLATDFHRLRIRCKRLRYALEFTHDLYGGRAEAFVKRLTKLQDKLGMMQDAEVAVARLQRLAVRHHEDLSTTTVFAMGGIAERHRVEAAALLARMPDRLALLRSAEWDDLTDFMEGRRAHAAITQEGRPSEARRGPVDPPADPPDTADRPATARPSGPPRTTRRRRTPATGAAVNGDRPHQG